MPTEKSERPTTAQQRPERPLLSPEQKRAKKARGKANREKRASERAQKERETQSDSSFFIVDYKEEGQRLARHARTIALMGSALWGVDDPAVIKNLEAAGEARRKEKQRARKAAHRPPKPPKRAT